MPPLPPYDRAIALACTLPALRTRWLFVRCSCSASRQHPIRMTLEQRPDAARWTLADLVVRMRYGQCRGRDVVVLLAEDHRIPTPTPTSGGAAPGWSLLLHGAVG